MIIFSVIYQTQWFSGNISSRISDHLPQFFILPEFYSKSPPTKYNIISHDWEKFNNKLFLQNFEKTNWNQVFQLNQNNVNITFENCLTTVNTLINSHARFKKTQQKTKKVFKGIQNAIEKKNRLFEK